MPGIFGVLHRTASNTVRVTADRMLVCMRHQPWYPVATALGADGSIALGSVALDATSAPPDLDNLSERYAAVVDGEIYDFEARRRELGAAGADVGDGDHAALIAIGFEQLGDRFLSRLDGYFSAAVWAPRDRVVTLVSGRFGMKPLYYAVFDDGLAFASEVKAVLKHDAVSKALSLRGVAQFFSFGHLLLDDTLYREIRVVPAATTVSYSQHTGKIAAHRYWRLVPGPPLAHDDALERLDHALSTAVKRRTADKPEVGLSLSGGLDARTILALVPREQTRVRSVSLGIEGSIDHRIASKLAEIAGAAHHRHYLRDDFLGSFPRHLQTLVQLTDGHYLDQVITVPTLAVYRELGISTLLRGHAGELFHMDKAYAFSIRARELAFTDGAELEAWLWSHLTDYMIGGLGHVAFRQPVRKEAETLARESMRQALLDSEGVDPPVQRLWHLFVSERLRRETALSMQMFNSVVRVRMPYIDNDLIEVVMSVAPALKMGDRIQERILRKHMPSFLDVVNANTGARVGASTYVRRMATFRLRVLGKLRVPGYQPYERLGPWLRQELQPLVRGLLLSDRAAGRGIFDPTSIRRIIDEHATGKRNHTYLLMAMIIFEQGQRQFVDSDLPSPENS